MDLKKTIYYQIDIILRLEEERKGLVKENKILKDKVKELSATVAKYSVPKPPIVTVQKPTNDGSCQTYPIILLEQSMQTEETVSQLYEAKSLLKYLYNSRELSMQLDITKYNYSRRLNTTVIPYKKQNKNYQTKMDQSLESEILKLTKYVNLLRKEQKDAQNQLKTRDKEIKYLKRCLYLKSYNLYKTRKEFNYLSILVNTDKFKSIRTLETELDKTKDLSRMTIEENRRMKQEFTAVSSLNDKLKEMLEQLTKEYENYKEAKDSELTNQKSKFSDMLLLIDKYKEQIWAYERNEKYLTESLKNYQERLMNQAT